MSFSAWKLSKAEQKDPNAWFKAIRGLAWRYWLALVASLFLSLLYSALYGTAHWGTPWGGLIIHAWGGVQPVATAMAHTAYGAKSEKQGWIQIAVVARWTITANTAR